MKILFFILLSLTSQHYGDECFLKTYSYLFIINKHDYIKETNCPDRIVRSFQRTIKQTKKKLKESYLHSMYPQYKITLIPKTIYVTHIKDLLPRSDHDLWKNLQFLSPTTSLFYDQKQELQIQCQHCQGYGKKNIKLRLSKKIFWISAVKMKESMAFVLKNLPFDRTSFLSKEMFTKKIISTIDPLKLFQDLKNIHYYKLKRNLALKIPLMKGHVSLENIIKYGQNVHVDFTTQGVQLKGHAIALENGKIDHVIQLKNIKTKKIIHGRVTGFNKASILQ